MEAGPRSLVLQHTLEWFQCRDSWTCSPHFLQFRSGPTQGFPGMSCSWELPLKVWARLPKLLSFAWLCDSG